MEHLNKLDRQIHGTCWDALMNAWGWWSMSLWGQIIILKRSQWSEDVPQDWKKTNVFAPALSDRVKGTREVQLAMPWSSGRWSEKILEAVSKYTKGKNVIWSNPVDFKRENCLTRLSSVIRRQLGEWGESCDPVKFSKALTLSAMTSFVDKLLEKFSWRNSWGGLKAWLKNLWSAVQSAAGGQSLGLYPRGQCEVNTNVILTTWLVGKGTPEISLQWYKIFLYLLFWKQCSFVLGNACNPCSLCNF